LLESKLGGIAQVCEVSMSEVITMYELKGLPLSSQKRWKVYCDLQAALGCKFHWIEPMFDEVFRETFRANSVVEKINSRQRTYFTLRRELGNEYLQFLQFFLNHRRFMRSSRAERVGKSTAELLTGRQHKHWLEMLGFELFKKAA
jgi:hypothetical protein